MITTINVQPGLEAAWEARIEHQLRLSLAALENRVARVTVDLSALEDSQQRPLYHCQLNTKLLAGQTRSITSSGNNPQACIVDAVARLRRQLIRQRRMALTTIVS